MAIKYQLQQGAIGDVFMLECINTANLEVTLPISAILSMDFIDPNNSITNHKAVFVPPNYISFTTSQLFNFNVVGVWKAQGFVIIGALIISKTALVSFEVLMSLA